MPDERLSTDSALRLLAAAYHEAGHAVVGRHFGWRIHRIFIEAADVRGGATLVQPETPRWRQRILVALAGDAARLRFDTADDVAVTDREIHTAQHDWSVVIDVLSDLAMEGDPRFLDR
jgi:hypothetical protein